MSFRILVVGSINMDLVMNMDKMPEGGQTVFGGGYSFIPGGKGSNQAVACARLGCHTGFVGCVGADSHGQILLDGLSNENIDVQFVRRSNAPTGLAVIPVEATGQNRIVIFPGANTEVTTQDVERALRLNWDAVVLQLEIPLPVVYDTIDMSRKRGIITVLDAGPAQRVELSQFRGLDILSPNESEAAALSGLPTGTYEQAKDAALYLLKQSKAKAVVLKLGDRGAILCENGECSSYPAFSGIKPVDTTAAGDSFTAGLTIKRVGGSPWPDAIRFANAVGALCVSKHGAQPSLPTLAEVEAFLQLTK